MGSMDSGSVFSGGESERPSQAFSVMTPSIARGSRASSTDHRNFHMSNPNPQMSMQKFYGARDDKAGASLPKDTPADMIRFGKRVTIGGVVNNEDLLKDHLKEMRQHL